MGTAIALMIAVAGQRWGEHLFPWLLPAMKARIQDILPEFRISFFALTEVAGQAQLRLQALLMRPLRIGHHVVDQLVLANAAVTLGAFWQPVAVATATAAMWPCASRRHLRNCARPQLGAFNTRSFVSMFVARGLAVLLACLLTTALSVLLAPSILAGLIIGDIYWHEASEQIIPHIVRLPRFLEEGGWLMVGLTTGALCAIAAQWTLTRCARGNEIYKK